MSTQHSAIADPNIHEPKNISTATAGFVYVANGAGSGTWQKLTSTSVDATANPFGGALLWVRDVRAQNTAGDTSVNTTWVQKTLQTVGVNQITGAALSGNQITGLPAGTYRIDASINVGASASAFARVKLYNITSAADLIVGANAIVFNQGGSPLPLKGSFTLSGTSTVEIRFLVGSSGAASLPANTASTSEVYAEVLIWRVA